MPREDVIVLACPLGLAEPLALKSAIGPLLAACTGEHSVKDIVIQFASYGVTQQFIGELLGLLEQHALLLGPSLELKRQEFLRLFRESPIRKSAFAGSGYPQEAEPLAQLVEEFLGRESSPRVGPPDALRLLVAPHIDYARGQHCYGLTFQALRNAEPDLVILLGTAHQYSPLLFHLCCKDFETPLGLVKTDKLFVRELLRAYGERAIQDEHLHAREHSLELQLPFLKHLCPNAKIVPILVGSFHRMLGSVPAAFPEYEQFAQALSTALESRWHKKRTLILAGVDMAHRGQHFGDSEKLSLEVMQGIEARDRQYLAALSAQDKASLFSHIAEDEDARRICGYPSLYLALDVLDRLRVNLDLSLIDYRQAVDYATDCAVTFAGLSGYERTSHSSTTR